MTTATKPKPAPAAATPHKVVYLGDVELSKVIVVRNARKRFDAKRLEELAQSIKDHGVQMPILLRPMPDTDQYELIAGERRLRASALAGKDHIPAKVLDVSEAVAAELRALENLHREGLTPLEEAGEFQDLMTKTGRSAEELASTIGKSPSYVYRAVALLGLPEVVLTAIEAGDITPAHGHQLLRLPPEEREEWYGRINSRFDSGVIPANALAKDIDEELGQDLKKAPWPKDEPYAFLADGAQAPACASCPSNSGNQGMLFDGATAGRCLNKPCYDAKLLAWGATVQSRTEAKAGKEGVPYVGAAKPKYDYKAGGETIKGHAIVPSDTLPAKGKRDGYGLAVNMQGLPVAVWVKLRDEAAEAKAQAAAAEGGSQDWQRERHINAAVEEALWAARAKVAAKTKPSRKVYEGVAAYFVEQDHDGLAAQYAAAVGHAELKLGKLTDAQVAGLLVLYTHNIRLPNEKAIEKAAKKAAGKAYDAAKKADGKAGKAAAAAVPGDEDGDEDAEA